MLGLGKIGGVLTFGGYDLSLLYSKEDDLQWISTNSEISYSITLSNLYVGNVHIPHVSRTGLIDSGSSWVLMPYEELEHIVQAFEQFGTKDNSRGIGKKIKTEANGYEYDTTMNTSLRTFFESYPTITFSTEDGGFLNWFPSEYFEAKPGTSIFGVQIQSLHGLKEIVLGASFLRQRMTIFDPSNHQIGFAMASCSDDNSRVVTDIVNSQTSFKMEQCHKGDLIQEEVNIILFFAVGLLVLMLLAIAGLVSGFLVKHIKSRRNKVSYMSYAEDAHNTSNDSTEMDHIGIIKHIDKEDDF